MSETNERSGASGGSVASAFGDWFDAQFPPEPGRLAGKTTDELLDMIVAGAIAQDELDHRQDRLNMERAALSAWTARLKIEADHASTPQVPRKYPASALLSEERVEKHPTTVTIRYNSVTPSGACKTSQEAAWVDRQV